MITPVWISLGSNLGDREETLKFALKCLDQTPGVAVGAVSSFRRTRPIGGPAGQGDFVNAAAKLETTLSPWELLKATQSVEDRLGRIRSARWGERTLDIDLLIFGSEFVELPELKIPHPLLAFRRFVLDPLVEIASGCVDVVTSRTIGDIKRNLDRTPRWIGLEGEDDSFSWSVFKKLVVGLSQSRPSRADWSEWNVAFIPWQSNASPLIEPDPKLTILVVLPSSSMIRKPSACSIPALWVASDQPDQIVAEVVTLCGGMVAV